MKESNTTLSPVSNYNVLFGGMRGICCLAIMLLHYPFKNIHLPVLPVYAFLHAFFIMSAYLVTRNLLIDNSRAKSFKQLLKIFYIKRTTRIFPAYFLYIFIMFAFAAVLHAVKGDTFGLGTEIKRYGWMLFTFTYNLKMWVALHFNYDDYMKIIAFPHLWSMSLEEQFYLMIIFVAGLGSIRFLRMLCIVAIIIFPIVRIAGFFWISQETDDIFLRALLLMHSPFFQFDAFFYGIALCVFDFKKHKWMLYVMAATGILILFFNFFNAYLCSHQEQVAIGHTLREERYMFNNGGIIFLDILVNTFFATWYLCLIHYPEKFKWLGSKFMTRMGDISYSMYIFQFMCLFPGMIVAHLLSKYMSWYIADAVGVAVFFGLTYWVSALVYKYVELPALGIKDKYLKKVYAEK